MDGKIKYSRHGYWVDWAAYIALRLVVCGISCLSLECCDRISRLMAIVLADWTKLRRKVTDHNLQLVYGRLAESELSRLRQQMWHHLLLMVCEIVHAPRKIHRTNWREHVYMRDKDLLIELLLDQRATIIVTGHFGNFEVAGFVTGLLGIKTATIARPLDNPLANDYLLQFRSGTGQKILPKSGSSSAVQELLESKGTLCILADQHAGPKGCRVDFFGHATSCHKSLALFVLSAKAPMVVTYARRLSRPLRFEIGITGVADPAHSGQCDSPAYLDSVPAMTRWYNERLEEAIRLAPEQYWWLHRRWRELPPVKRKQKVAREEAQTETTES